MSDEKKQEATKCSICGKDATGEYEEGIPTCGSVRCDLTVQHGLDYIEDRR